ncbi:hypothetical protein [Rhodanobacter sp. MP1X3]|jgi:hypothetical protein|uniref:hypothetical protein n=1 Tax=Rhodanobacter sp. MP1X3 TaxID=2723086 RepID=UPI00161F99EA|nr:hypothetical protein [Rhodanobacter sp. MP1X3]MBB6243935.1 hypothetical protein [Rhodanobacter sp. MP1X3]
MWHLALTLTIVVLAVAINVGALKAGEDRFDCLYYAVSVSGAFGIFFIVCIPLSLLYALINYTFGPAQGTSIFLNVAIVGAGACTLASLLLCIGIWYRESHPYA